jgi:hypothetical protein
MLMPRGLGLTCPSGQQPTNMYDGSVSCCGVPGTPCLADPCCILNNPGFIAEQNAQVAQDIASIPASSFEGQTLQALMSVPTNIGEDAVKCQSNPGLTFVDNAGVTITCPSPSHSDLTTGGQPMSTFTTGQLAQMLNSQFGGQAPQTAGETPFFSPSTTVPAATIKAVVPKTTVAGSGTQPAGGGSPAPDGSTNTGGSTSSSSSSSGVDLSFLTNSSLINGVPNWMVGFGALAALIVLPSLMGGRR